MPDLPFPVRAGDFEGPLDLLLALVRQHQVRIQDIPLADITSQFLQYLHSAAAADIDLGSDFVLMAATLIAWKSKALLPHPHPHTGPQPHRELLNRLEEHERARAAAELLRLKLDLESASWSAAPSPSFDPAPESEPEPPPPPGVFTLADLIDTLESALAHVRSTITVTPDTVTLDDRMQWLRTRLQGVQEIDAATIFAEQPSHEAEVLAFSAMLELARLGDCGLSQPEHEGPLHLSTTMLL